MRVDTIFPLGHIKDCALTLDMPQRKYCIYPHRLIFLFIKIQNTHPKLPNWIKNLRRLLVNDIEWECITYTPVKVSHARPSSTLIMFSSTGRFFSVPSSTTKMSLPELQGMFGVDDAANK